MTFEVKPKKKDDEMLIWLIVGGMFTLMLIGMDIFYSSYSQMSDALRWVVVILHAVLVIAWIGVMVKFNDPNFDTVRKMVVYLCIILALIVGIHHASTKEDQQVLIDSTAAAETYGDRQGQLDSNLKMLLDSLIKNN